MKNAKLAERRTQEQRRDATQRALVNATIDCLYESGFAGSTLAAIAKRAGVTRGAVQHYFDTGDDLYMKVLDTLDDALAGSAAMPASAGIAARVRWSLALQWDVVRSRHYIAALQVLTATRCQPQFHRKVLGRIRLFEAQLDHQWQTLFSDAEIPLKQVATARHVAFAALRGLALRSLYVTGLQSCEQELAMLEAMISLRLGAVRNEKVRVK